MAETGIDSLNGERKKSDPACEILQFALGISWLTRWGQPRLRKEEIKFVYLNRNLETSTKQ